MAEHNLRKLLSFSNKGKHTVFCKIQNGFIELAGTGESEVDGYFFPGTLHNEEGEELGIAYLPALDKVTVIPLNLARVIKPVKVWLDKVGMVEELWEQIRFWKVKLSAFHKKLHEKNPILAVTLTSVMQGISNENDMDDKIREFSLKLLDGIKTEMGECDEIESLRKMINNYHEHCKKRNTFLEAHKLVDDAKAAYQNREVEDKLSTLSEEDEERLKETIRESVGSESEMKMLMCFVHAKTALQVMMLGGQQFYTEEELKEKMKEIRPEFKRIDDAALTYGIKNGLKIAEQGLEGEEGAPSLPSHLVEYNEIMKVWSLTKDGSSLALGLLKAEKEQGLI